MVLLTGETGLAGSPKTSYILHNTTPPFPSQTGEGTVVKEEE